MSKWADYGISAVRYNAARTHIDQVRAHEDKDESFGPGTTYSRAQVVRALKNGTTFITIPKDARQAWTKGQPVKIVTLYGTEYIKTTSNSRAADNLENLPEF